MNHCTLFAVAAVFAIAGCSRKPETAELESIPNVVTADIQAGIEKHVAGEVTRGNGYFSLTFDGQPLKLKLVKVHTEYLANLGPRRHFACVDLADVSGDVYDVDFFLEGDPGSMRVTETTVHKHNGQPYYAWEQEADGTWHRIAIEEAGDEHLGIVKGADEFEFVYRATLPRLDESARMWLPLAVSDEYQTVEILAINAPGARRRIADRAHGNQVLFLELAPADSGKTVEIRYDVNRKEKKAYAADAEDAKRFLAAERLVPAGEDFGRIAAEVTAGKEGDLVRARAIYDYTIDRMKYIKTGDGWGKGDAVYACDIGTGNCTDYHALFIAVARAAGIPARFAIGASIASGRDEGALSGYHCWAEFYAEGKWWPVDISEADKYTGLATYYFGRHPANRIELSKGRDLVLDPSPASGPINFLAYPVLEVGGRTVKAKVRFSFTRSKDKSAGMPGGANRG
jgi:transglutaminase-like putative cysteine protease